MTVNQPSIQHKTAQKTITQDDTEQKNIEQNIKDRYIATFLGCAIGDSLGMPIEGWKKEQIERYVGRVTTFLNPVIIKDERTGIRFLKDEYGPLKCYTEDLKAGEFTDDTLLTIALAESLIESKRFDLDNVSKHQLAAYESQRQPDGSIKGGFGRTTADAFKNLKQGIGPSESGVIGGPGNAPAMKISPLGIYMDAKKCYQEGLAFAAAVGKITHLDPRSLANGVVQAHAVYSVLQNISRDELVDLLVDVCVKWEKPVTPEFRLYEQGSLHSRLEWIAKHKDASVQEAYDSLHNSYMGFSSHPFALFMVQKYWDDPITGLIETVNYGGDCDTTGAMYGAICGAKNGMIFPTHLVNGLREKEKLISLGEKMYALRTI